MKKNILFIFLILPLFLFSVEIEFLFTNDIGGSISPTLATWMNKDFPPPIGNGLSALKMIKEERQTAQEEGYSILLFDSGSLMRHDPLNKKLNMDSVIWYFNEAQYDVINVGVYDTYYGPEVFKKLFSSLNAEVVSSNLHAPGEGEIYHKYVIKEVGDVKVGIFGMVPASLKLYIPEACYPYFSADDETLTARAMVKELKEKGCDVIVMLSSCGYTRDYRIAENVKGIDVILGGFDGKGMRKVEETPVNHTIIYRTYGKLGSVGKLKIKTGITNKVKEYSDEMITLFEERYPYYQEEE